MNQGVFLKNSIFLLVFLLLSSTIKINSQWGPVVRLTYDAAASYISSHWSIAANGNDVHFVWYDERNGGPFGNKEIYYIRSSDGGVSWGTETRLTNNVDFSLYPTVAVNGSAIHVVWADRRDGNFEIYYKRSTNSGLTWGPDTRLTNNTFEGSFPSVAADAAGVYVVWHDDRDFMNYPEIYFKKSTDGGASWSPNDTRITNNAAHSSQPIIAVIGSYLHVVWED